MEVELLQRLRKPQSITQTDLDLLTRFFNSLEEPTPEVASHLSLITSVLN